MQLIGMLDSPYVRRVAISLRLLDLAFEHKPLSVFSTFDAFAAINPVVKAPTFVTDDGIVLMDSTLILEHVERLAAPGRSLVPSSLADHARAQRVIGLALAACEKAVQIAYENNLRPAEIRYQPWLDRVHGQLLAATRLLEAELAGVDAWLFGERPLQGDITAAVAARFARAKVPDAVTAADHPTLTALIARAEATPAFAAFDFS